MLCGTRRDARLRDRDPVVRTSAPVPVRPRPRVRWGMVSRYADPVRGNIGVVWNDAREVISMVRRVQRQRPATAEAVAAALGRDARDLEQLLEAMVDKGMLESTVLLTRANPADSWRLRRRSYQVVWTTSPEGPTPPAGAVAPERSWGVPG